MARIATDKETLLAGKRILVVEDTALVAQEIEFMLNRLNCIVLGPVAGVEEALEVIREKSFDGVILDINLQGRECYPIAEELSARGIPFILTTGYGSGSIQDRFKDAPRLEKPFGLNDMVDRMTSVFVT